MPWTDALSAVLPTLLVALGGAVGWWFKSQREELAAQRGKLAEKKLELYVAVMEPYRAILTNEPDGEKKALKLMTEPTYRNQLFQVLFYGSDEVVRRLVDLMEAFYYPDASKPFASIKRFGELAAAVRKDLQRSTGIDYTYVLRLFTKDYRAFEERIKAS